MSLPVTKSCPECNAKLGWANVVNGLYCLKCELLDVKFSSEPFPNLSDVVASHADEGYELIIEEKMIALLQKDMLAWNKRNHQYQDRLAWDGQDYEELKKIKKYEDSFNTDVDEYIEQNFSESDIVPLEIEETDPTIRSENTYTNNPVIRYCFVRHFCGLGLRTLRKIYNEDLDEKSGSDTFQLDLYGIFGFGGVLHQCITYLAKMNFIVNQKDQEFFENIILDHYYYSEEKEPPTIWRWGDGADKHKFVLRYKNSHKQIRLRVGLKKYTYSYIPNDGFLFEVVFLYKNNKIDIISYSQNSASEFYCSERLKKHIQEILGSHFPELDLENINTEYERAVYFEDSHQTKPIPTYLIPYDPDKIDKNIDLDSPF